MAAATSARFTTSDPASSRDAGAPHLRQHRRAADAVDERGDTRKLHGTAGCKCRRERRRRVHFASEDAHLGPDASYRCRDAAAQTAAAEWNENGIHIGQVLEDLEPDRAVAGHHIDIADRMDERSRLQWRVSVLDENVPPLVVRQRDRFRSQALDRLELGVRRAIGHDDGASNSESPRIPRDTLRHVPGAGCVHARLQRAGIEHRYRIGGAANLERSDRLQVLELEIELAGASVVQTNQRRARHDAVHALTGILDVFERDRVRLAVAHGFVAGGDTGSWAKRRNASASTTPTATGP